MSLSRLIRLPITVGLLTLLPAAAADAQDEDLRLERLFPFGTRVTLTDGGGTLLVTLTNRGSVPREARVVVEYADRPGARYSRDVWVPAAAGRTSWLPVGPPPAARGGSAEVHVLLTDRTGGERLVLPAEKGEKVRARGMPFVPRAPSTTILADPMPYPPDPTSAIEQAVALVRVVRAAASLPGAPTIPPDGPLPPTPEAFDGTDHVVLAGNRLAADPAGRWALRQWVERGGRLWVMLDMTDPEAVAPLLGDDQPLKVVDRVGLTRVQLHRAGSPPPEGREFDRPVELVRVVPADCDHVFAVANGWPAGFSRPLGRGRVLFTTLGGAGWLPPPAPPLAPLLPPTTPKGSPRLVSRSAQPGELEVSALAAELHPRGLPPPLSPEVLRPLLEDEVGYSVMGRGLAAAILGGFLVAVVVIAVVTRRSRRPELVGWLAPAAAVAAAGVFVVHSGVSRRAVPPTVASAAIAEAVAGTDEVVVTGLFAVYQPESGPAPLEARRGGVLDLDAEGLEGQTRTRVQTDTDAWHVEDLALPAGVRTGRFQYTARPGPVAAVARFGLGGVDGRLVAPGFGAPTDALALTPARRPVALRFGPDGSFAGGPDDAMPTGQFLADAALSDRQQRRQAVYRQLLGDALPPHLDGRDLLFAWASEDVPFTGRAGGRAVGTALLVAPLVFERTPPGTRVTVPAAFVAVRRSDLGRVTTEGGGPVEMPLRFVPPATVLPLDVERAVLRLQVRAPGRRVTVTGTADGRAVPLFAAESPAGPVRVEITNPRLLRPDADGGLHLTVAVTDPGPAPAEGLWRIDELGLDVTGRTAGAP
jgi:hypothetical protein